MRAQNPLSDTATGILGLVGISALAGVLVTAAVTPALAVTGMAANNSINMFENLPGYLEIDDLSEKTDIYVTRSDNSTYLLASFFDENREEVAWESISQYVKDAAIAGEDPRFYEHGGVDVQGTLRGAIQTFVYDETQGGSSITQQYVKNVLINNGTKDAKNDEEFKAAYDKATETTPSRKLKEMRYAIALEKKYTKNEILRGYLNIAGFGGRVYGIEAASQYFFGGTSAANLSLPQAASLIAIVNNPEKFRLDYAESETNGANTVNAKGEAVPYAENKQRRDYILEEMLKYNKITQTDYDAAVATPVQPIITEPSTGCQSAAGSAFFCDAVALSIKNHYDDPATEDVNEGSQMLQKRGLQVYTTLDPDLQVAAETALNENVPYSDPRFDVGSVAVTVQPGTGRVLAMAQNKLYTADPDLAATSPDYTSVNYSTDFALGGSSGLQPGSTFKVFTLAEWLNQGHSLLESFNGARRGISSFPAECYGGWSGAPFNPRNDDATNANNAVDATKYSVNSSFMAMAQQLDLCRIRDTAQAFGVTRADGLDLGQKYFPGTRDVNPDEVFGPSAILGTEEVAPVDMAAAFAGIANNGSTCSPIFIDKIYASDGEEIVPPLSNCTQSVTTQVASAMQYAMAQTFGGTASASNTRTGVAHIGKTGTTDGAKDTWMIGSSTTAATAVWVGNVVGDANLRQLDFDSGGASTARHRMWKAIMTVADEKYGGNDFTQPDGSFFRQVLTPIPQVVGLTLDQAKAAIEQAGFVFEAAGEQDSNLPAGTVTATNPGVEAGKGTTVQVFVSNGKLVGVPNVVGAKQADAENQLRAAGFKVKRTDQDTTDPLQVGVVLAQNPASGAAAKPGDEITIAVGKLDT